MREKDSPLFIHSRSIHSYIEYALKECILVSALDSIHFDLVDVLSPIHKVRNQYELCW